MFIRDLSVYRLKRKLGVADLNDLEAALRHRTHRELSPMEFCTDGFVPPMPAYRGTHALIVGRSELSWHDEELDFIEREPFMFEGFANHATDALVLAFYREERAVVSSDVKRRVQKEVNRIEESEGRKVYMKERQEIKQAVMAKLMPGLQSRYYQVPIAILNNGLVFVGAVGKKAELALSELREVLGTFPVVPLQYTHPVPFGLTAAAKLQAQRPRDEALHGFVVADDFQMQQMQEHPAVARMKNTDVTEDEVQGLLADKVVTHANLLWNEQISFKLDPKFAIRRLKIADSAFEQSDGEDDEDLKGALYASYMIELDLITKMLEDFALLFGGEVETAALDDSKEAETPLVLKNLRNFAVEGNSDNNDNSKE